MEPTNPAEQKTEAQAPAPVAQEPKAEEHRIPKARFDEVIAERKALADQLAAMQAEVAALKNTKAQEATKAAPADDLQRLRADVAAIKEQAYHAELQKGLGLQSEEQTKAVATLLKSNPDLKPSEALTIAASRNADLFGGKDQRAFNPGQHGSLSAKGNGIPTPETLKDRVIKVGKIADPIVRAREEQRIHGKELAKLMGLPRTD